MKTLNKLGLTAAITMANLAFTQPLLAANQAPVGQELMELKSQTTEILNLLVEEGILSKEKVASLIQRAKDRARQEYKTSVEEVDLQKKDTPPPYDSSVVRVPYIPQYIRDQIRNQVREDLKQEVTQQFVTQAKNERMKVPGTWPEWVDRVQMYGDLRLRAQMDRFADNNTAEVRDFLEINKAGGAVQAGDKALINITEDRNRARLRFRAGIKAKINDQVSADIRFAGGKGSDPVSTNQTLGNYNKASTINLDRAYLKYKSRDKTLTLAGGRIKNPWFATDLIWDSDLNFDGVAATYRWKRNLEDEEPAFDPFVTVGAFPLQEVRLSSDDKWLYAAQAGFKYRMGNWNELKVGLAYYDYKNVVGRLNAVNSDALDFTAPEFVQIGNSMFDISNDGDNTTQRAALLSDYDQLALTLSYDISNFDPTHIKVMGEYVKNIGFDKKAIEKRAGREVKEQTQGYKLGVTFGSEQVMRRSDWQVSLAYKYLERDAVLDAFTDSDFHLGGTDARGYILTAKYGLSFNTWLQFRMLMADEIDSRPFGVNTFQLDLSSRF